MIYVIGVKYIGYMIYGNFVIICGRYIYMEIFYFNVFDFLNLFLIFLIFYLCKFFVNIFKFLIFIDRMELNMIKLVSGKFLW